MNRILKFTIFSTSAILLSLLLFAQTDLLQEDISDWTKLTIEEVFISRQTNLEYGDFASAPEFGWKIYKDNIFLSRSSNIYATMYYPVPESETVRLILIERDFLKDDTVSGVYLDKDKTRYILNMNSDFVIISRKSFFPDKNSSSDSKPGGARIFKNDINDSVSFLNGDYTDYYKINKDQTVMIIASSTLDLSIQGSQQAVIYPKEKTIQDVYIIDSKDPASVRIRGKIAQGKINYHIISVSGDNRPEKLLNEATSYIKKGNQASTVFFNKSFVRAFSQYSDETIKSFCKEVEKNPDSYSKKIHEICKAYKRDY